MNLVRNGIYRLHVTTKRTLDFVVDDNLLAGLCLLSTISIVKMPENISRIICICYLFYLALILLRNIVSVHPRVFISDKYCVAQAVSALSYARVIFSTDILNTMGNPFMNFLSAVLILYYMLFILENHFGVSLKSINFSLTPSNKFFHAIIDEEGCGYLNDLKLEWKKSGLTQNQINREEVIFVLSHYWGRFISWMRLPRFLSPTKTR
jgi:hypothetical protein